MKIDAFKVPLSNAD